MTHFDFSPLFRSTIGFDRLADMLDTALSADVSTYPPYNIEATGENAYRITMAVAGFHGDDISVVQSGVELVISAHGQKEAEQRQYLYRGIAGRSFERRFQLAEHVKVADARLENGLLQIDLVRELPEALRPRKITIGKGLLDRITKKAA